MRYQLRAEDLGCKWEDKAVWKPFLRPTVNINHFMSDGASPMNVVLHEA